jgi:natural product biosynthesis luciferase-like monooxygenase protein/amino acid adenylation domain-containing protein
MRRLENVPEENTTLAEDQLDAIAVVGLAGRLPGARDLREFWSNLCNGVESVRFFSDEELLEAGVSSEVLNLPNCVKAKAILDDVDKFDAAFFGFTPREAEISDPQQRLFLECSWEALENAGYDPETYAGRIGVYAGSGLSNYWTVVLSNPEISKSLGSYRTLIGNDKDYLSTLVSYRLNLKGPSVVVQTACSTSLVAVHIACQALLNGECDIALAGGISIRLPQKSAYLFQEGAILSPDGHCRAFDADAQGTVSGNGAALVVLKRLADALADRDNIRAVIRGSAINNDGAAKVGFTAPSIEGQVQVINEALGVSGVDPETITYIEAHGTGTSLGDPVELSALTKALGPKTSKQNFCGIGSLKTNIGHLDAAAGAAGLLKTVLMLEQKKLPPSLNFKRPNPKIDFENSPFYVQANLADWTGETPRRAGVSSFGIGGTNAHVIVEEAPPRAQRTEPDQPRLILLSAKTDSALERVTENLIQDLEENPAVNLADVAYTLQVGRHAMEHRRMFVSNNTAGALSLLRTRDPKRVFNAFAKPKFRPVMFMFPGQGTQYVNMGLELYREEPFFRELIDRCAEILSPSLGLDLRGLLYPTEENKAAANEKLRQTQSTQPALFVIEYCLARLWMHWGIQPEAMIGHSVGEYVAACLAGVFTLEEALPLIAIRGQLVAEMPEGQMLAVRLSEDELTPLLNGRLSLAAVNSTSQCVVAGDSAAIARLEGLLEERSVVCSRLNTSHAMHSAAMDPILDAFREHLQEMILKPPSIRYLSNVTGTWITPDKAVSPDYWARHLRETVRFAQGVEQLLQEPDAVLLEVGPGRILGRFAQQSDHSRTHPVFTSLPSAPGEERATAFVLQTLGSLWLQGIPIEWSRFHSQAQRYRIALPSYPFERERYWVTPSAQSAPDAKQLRAMQDEILQPIKNSENKPEATMPEHPVPGSARSRRQDAILAMLHATVYKLIGIETGEKDIHVNFFDLGVDSLLIIQFTQAVEEQCGQRIPFRLLFEELTTLDAVSQYLDEHLPPEMFADEPEVEVTVTAPAVSESFTPAAEPVRTVATTEELPALPAAPAAIANPALKDLYSEQLRIMSQQLEIMRHMNHTAPSLSSVEPVAEVFAQTTREEKTATVKSPSPRTDAESFLPHKPLELKAADDLSSVQSQYLNEFTKRYVERTARSKQIAQGSRGPLADSRLTVGFSLLLKELVYPIYGQRAAGSKIWDVDGNEYVDISMGYGVNLFGNSPPFITAAIEQQLKAGVALVPQLELTAQLASLICELTGVERVSFCNSGTEAVMGALRAARTTTRRRRFAMFSGSYHGWSDGTLVRTLNGGRSVPVAPGVDPKTVEDVLVLDYGAPESLEIIKAHAHELAAVLVEPVQSRRPELQPREFLHALRELTAESGTALIFDEMITGFRIHPGGAQAWFGVQADLATYGKIVGGGLPIGVVAGKSKFMDAFDGGRWNYGDSSYPQADKTFFAAAFFKHPLAMAAGYAVLKRLQEEGPALHERLNRQTADLATGLNSYFEQQGVPLRVVHFGSLFRFVIGREIKYPELFGYHLINKGIHIWEGGNYFLSTAHSEADIRKVIDAVKSSVVELQSAGFLPRRPDDPGGPTIEISMPPPPLPSIPGGPSPVHTSANGSNGNGAPSDGPHRLIQPATVRPLAPSSNGHAKKKQTIQFSLYYFGNYDAAYRDDKYDLIFQTAKFADQHGFAAVWVPERHFDAFGGFSPNPSVLAAALARETQRIHIRAGSVALPLHNPIRVAEEWAVVDNLSKGRVGISFASGWHRNDFVLAPEVYVNRREVMHEGIDTVRRLWRGESVSISGVAGEDVKVRLVPLPMQPELPFWLTVGTPKGSVKAGELGARFLTNFMGRTFADVAERVRLYRKTVTSHHGANAGHVTLQLHTFLSGDLQKARQQAQQPLSEYLAASLALKGGTSRSQAIDLSRLSEADRQYVFSGAYKDYVNDAGLIGTPDHCAPLIDKLIETGVDEICCLIDFGVDLESTLESLHYVNELKERYQQRNKEERSDRPVIEVTTPRGSREFPMTEGQKQLWALAQLGDDANSGYNESLILNLRGRMDVVAMRRALQKLVDRHEALRIRFSEDGEHQHIDDYIKVPVPLTDLSGLDEAERAVNADGWSKIKMSEPFNLSQGPLFRFRLARLEPEYHLLVFTYHHAIVDGQSIGVFFQELNAIYSAECRGEVCVLPEARRFSDYLQELGKQRSEVDEDANEAYWVKTFAGGMTRLNLPMDHPRPAVQSFKRRRYTASLDASTSHKLQQWCRANRCTGFLMVLAAFKVFLYKLTGQRDLLVAITTADSTGVASKDLMGFRLNALALQTQVADDPTFIEFLASVRRLMWDAYAHQDVSLSKLYRILREPWRRDRLSPLTVKFNLDRGSDEMQFHELKVTVDANPSPAPMFDLTLDVNEKSNQTIFQWNFDPELFEESTIRKWMGHFEQLLAAIVENPERPLSALPPQLFEPPTGARTLQPKFTPVDHNGHALVLTKIQQRVWTWQKLHPDQPIYNQGGYWIIPALIDRDHFERAIARLIQNVDAFRAIILEKEGLPYQYFRPQVDFSLNYHDFSRDADPGAAFKRWTTERCQRPFELDKSLVDFALVKLGDKATGFYMNLAQIIADASSVMLTQRLVSDYYQLSLEGRLNETKPLSSFQQFVRREQEYLTSPRAAQAEAYWREKLADSIEPIEFYGKPASKHTARITRSIAALGPIRSRRLNAAARDPKIFALSADASLFAILTAIFSTYVYRISGSAKLSIGVPFHNRRSNQESVGLFMNVLPMRLSIERDETFLTLIRKVQGDFVRMLRHSEYPVGNAMQEEAYDLVINYINMPALFEFNGIPVEHEWVRSRDGKESLSLQFRAGSEDDLVVEIDAHCDVFDDYQQGQIVNHFVRVVDGFLEDHTRKVRQVDLLTAAERSSLLQDFNNTGESFPHQESFAALFERQAAANPDRVALTEEGNALTYSCLNEKASSAAHTLRARGFGPEKLVGVLAHRGIDFLTTMLALFKAGATCLALDPTAPEQRLARSLSQGEIILVLVGADCVPNLLDALDLVDASAQPPEFVQIDELLSQNYDAQSTPVCVSFPRNLSYVIYTSGSTGAPKGAMIEQEGMLNHLFLKINDLKLDQQSVVAQTAPQSFDIFVWQSLAALLVGGSIHVVNDEDRRDPSALHLLVKRQGITVLEVVPSFLRALLDTDEGTGFSWSTLKLLVVTGEALPYDLCRRWLDLHPNIPIVNAYGPTECSDDVTHNFISAVADEAPEIAPLGRPVANIQIYILDKELFQVPTSMVGEVCVGGIGVGRGYLGDPQRTSESFIPNPYATKPGERLYRTADLGRQRPDGAIEFLGRADQQVKIRGYRIEPGEIEAHLSQHLAIREATIVGHEVEPGVKRLIAYVVPREAGAVTSRELRRYLEDKVPEYMVPSAFVILEAMPLTASGKIDRKALPLPAFERNDTDEAFVAPKSPIEEVLAGIWRKVLRLDQVGINNNFFELGGDSILAVQVAVRAKQAGLKLAPMDIFENQMLAELADKVGSQSLLQAEQGQVTGPVPITASQKRWLETSSINDREKTTTVVVDLRAEVDPELLEQALEQLVSHHDALRLRFTPAEDGNCHQFNGVVEHSRPLVRMDLSRLPESELTLAMETVITNIQAELDLSRGTTIQAAFIRLPQNRGTRFVLAIHALAADDRSWEILLSDLQLAYEQLSLGESVRFAPKTTSFKQWAQKNVAKSESFSGEHRSRLPVDVNGTEETISEFDMVNVSLHLDSLVADGAEPPQLEWDQLALRVLAKVIAAWTATSEVLIDVLEDQRAQASDTMNLSRTIGPLTLARPISMTVTNDEVIFSELHSERRADVTFGFMDQSDFFAFDSVLFERPLETFSRQRAHASWLEVFGSILGRQIRFEWAFSKQHFAHAAVAQLAARFADDLEIVLKAALEHSPDAYLTDFNWEQQDLDQVRSVISKL